MRSFIKFLTVIIPVAVLFSSGLTYAQDEKLDIIIQPDEIKVTVGDELQLSAILVDENGNTLTDDIIFYSRSRNNVAITRDGLLIAKNAGTFTGLAQYSGEYYSGRRFRKSFEIIILPSPIEDVTIVSVPENIYEGTTIEVGVKVTDQAGLDRSNDPVILSTSDESIAAFVNGKLKTFKSGKIDIKAEAGGKMAEYSTKILKNPVQSVEIIETVNKARTGDVVDFQAKALDKKGNEITDIPIRYTFMAEPDDNLATTVSGQVSQNGKFVANIPGNYTLIAQAGSAIDETNVRVDQRNVKQRLEVVGHGPVLDVHTSDLWVWEGVDGRDYAVTGTWGANGDAYFWDVTDPSNITLIDTVHVDARTVNDVKISEDGRIGVLTREGASNRKNGIVILDVSNPRDVKILSEYTNDLTGGVHNAFIYENHVYAVNNGRKYDIINIEDPTNPRTVSKFELDTPGHSIHDVWIEDGIAYSSNWSDGIVAVDVGSGLVDGSPEKTGVAGGSPENPVFLGSYSYPSGWNHAAFPFKSKSTGDFYVIAGDEAFPQGLPSRNNPVKADGWLHFVKFDGWDSPDEVARYQIPEAGTHNYWVIDDVLFVAYYNAGLRIVDISGELMGNLYNQGREIATFEPNHPDALIPNSPFTWGPQPHKGHIFISDWNSGIWAVKLVDENSGLN